MTGFDDPATVSRYAQGTVQRVPGLSALHLMALLLLGEGAARDAAMLVVGAGGGMEIDVFARARPGWSFDGVDTSAEMLSLASDVLAPFGERVRLHEGLVDVAPEGPFDGAACLLTLHFVDREERLRTLREIRRRLKPGAPLVVAHHSFPQGENERSLWLSRYAAFAAASGIPSGNAENGAVALGERLPLLSPEEDEALIAEAGFADVSLFYAAFTFRGWVARA
ncbi:MAG: methyltransferase [Stappia sp.]|uniref:class I SAM-dependent methyltransferase n=1 Tax=Stappia sp. TaxID=1870903 RepID=UPI000C6378BB|nr:class I SAM-dependent methyltransferase [Stappia sp.]MAA98013.1 methyltransferase [Stappia sp.]MBM22364.1 methyltransferase [Stappia sp.]